MVEGCSLGPITTIFILKMKIRKLVKSMVSITWKKILLWRGATLREAVTFSWTGGYCQSKLTSHRGTWRINILTTLLSLCPVLPSNVRGFSVAQPNRRAKGLGYGQVLILEQKDTVHKFGELTVISKQKV